MALRRFIEKILEHPAVYTAWQAPFVSQKFAPVERHLAHLQVRRVLDVGCGPGTNAPPFAGADYVGMDINEEYLAIARAKYGGRFVQADLATAEGPSVSWSSATSSSSNLPSLGTFDTILVNSFLHHLPDQAVMRLLHQLQRLLDPDGRVHILELVVPERRSLAKVMARLDRGRYARPLATWRTLFTAHFDPLEFEPYQIGGGLWAMVYFQGRARSCVSR
jgi:SAM-dependent methyltransferase